MPSFNTWAKRFFVKHYNKTYPWGTNKRINRDADNIKAICRTSIL